MAFTSVPAAGQEIQSGREKNRLHDYIEIENRWVSGYDITTSSSSLDVDVATGVAIVDGARVGLPSDSKETLTLDSNATNYIILQEDGTLTYNTSGSVSSTELLLWTVTTDGSGVTGTTDKRDPTVDVPDDVRVQGIVEATGNLLGENLKLSANQPFTRFENTADDKVVKIVHKNGKLQVTDDSENTVYTDDLKSLTQVDDTLVLEADQDGDGSGTIDHRINGTTVWQVENDGDLVDQGTHDVVVGGVVDVSEVQADDGLTLEGDADGDGSGTVDAVLNGTTVLSATSNQVDAPGQDIVDTSPASTVTVYDASNQWVPLATLEADTITVTAGDKLSGGGSAQLGTSITIDHSVSGAADLSTGAGEVVDSLTFDSDGHVTGTTTKDLDGRYILEAGDTMAGDLDLGGNSLTTVDTVEFEDRDGSGDQFRIRENSSTGNLQVDYFDGTSWSSQLRYEPGSDTFEILNADLASNGTVIWDDSSGHVPSGVVEDVWVNESGDTMSGDLNMGGNSLQQVSHLEVVGVGSDPTLDSSHAIFYQSDGTTGVTGADGDVILASEDSAATAERRITLLDFSAGGIPNSALVNDDVTVTAGTDLTGGGAVALGASITINHADTSSQGDVDTSGGDIIDSVTLDPRGHVTGMTTRSLDGRYLLEGGDQLTGDLDPSTDRGVDLGSSSLRYDDIHAHTVHTGDLALNDPYCVRCGDAFTEDDDLVFTVTEAEGEGDDAELTTVPIHAYHEYGGAS